MAEITIDVTVDDSAWQAATDRILAALPGATHDASMEAAALISAITKGKLYEKHHDTLDFSNAPPGSPPASVTGALAASIDYAPWGFEGAMVGPTGGYVSANGINGTNTTDHYARIQELGGTMSGHMRFYKQFGGTVREIKREFIELYPRPYLRPATEEAIASGEVEDIYARHWWDAIEMG